MKDGSWVRLPHAGDVDVSVVAEVSAESSPSPPAWNAAPLLSIESAARRLNMKEKTLTQSLTPSSAARRNGAPFVRNGFKVTREGLGKVRLTPVAP
jgi:hypothetical protein